MQQMSTNATWVGMDEFPSNRIWANEVEEVLEYLKAKKQFERLLPRLRGNLNERDGALAEGRVAYVLARQGFSIVSWEPIGNSGKKGEFEIKWQNNPPIFVEVKGPRWEGELSDIEKKGNRKKQKRYINGEVRPLDPIERILFAIDKSIDKYSLDKFNMLVTVCDLLFTSPFDWPWKSVKPRIQSYLSNIKYSNLGGILLFNSECKSEIITYKMAFIENPEANSKCKLSTQVINYFYRISNG